jgi:hypothetical protein
MYVMFRDHPTLPSSQAIYKGAYNGGHIQWVEYYLPPKNPHSSLCVSAFLLPSLFFVFFYFFGFLVVLGFELGLRLARQALYHLSYSFSSQCFSYREIISPKFHRKVIKYP